MSAFRALVARRAPFAASPLVQRAAFHNSVVRVAGKESKLRKPHLFLDFSCQSLWQQQCQTVNRC